MGKGDKKSKRGKIIQGSYGVTRPRNKNKKNTVVKNVPELKNEVKKAEKVIEKAPQEPKAIEVEKVVEVSEPVEAVENETKKVDTKKSEPKKSAPKKPKDVSETEKPKTKKKAE
ncbi:MAG: 30S ribosomal protein THX [Bacteroidales bacterium]|nr:30S ribosomal protein THX [Bacteroidales bacterium]